MFCKKGVPRNFAKFTGKHLCQSPFFNKVAGLRPATLLKKRLWHRCFPVNFAKFLRTPFFTKHLRWLLEMPLTFMYISERSNSINNRCYILLLELVNTKCKAYVILETKRLYGNVTCIEHIINKSTFTWDQKWIQTGLKSQTALKSHSVYMKISLRQRANDSVLINQCYQKMLSMTAFN